MGIRVRNDENFTLELTPMIDVVFLLIVFFLLATTFHRLEREIEVSVPTSATADSGDGPDPVVVNVLASGEVIVFGNRIELVQLTSLLARRHEQEPALKALIRGDGRLSYDRIIEVADACRKSGVAISFATHEQR